MSKRTILLAIAVLIALIATIFSAYNDAKLDEPEVEPEPEPGVKSESEPTFREKMVAAKAKKAADALIIATEKAASEEAAAENVSQNKIK